MILKQWLKKIGCRWRHIYGGLAITASGTTAVHALSYPLGGKYHIAHGVSNAILLAPVMRFNAKTKHFVNVWRWPMTGAVMKILSVQR